MTAKRVGIFYRVREVLDVFVQMGCDLNVAEDNIVDEDGDVSNVRYLVDPSSGRFVPVVDLSDGDYVSSSEVDNWERRLGITIPRPPALPNP